jgi:hypothetical protein
MRTAHVEQASCLLFSSGCLLNARQNVCSRDWSRLEALLYVAGILLRLSAAPTSRALQRHGFGWNRLEACSTNQSVNKINDLFRI